MTDRPIRRSRRVIPTLLAAAATAALATLNGCSHNTTTARCVGPDGRVLPDSACQGGGYGGGGYYGGHAMPYRQSHWVYGGSGGTAVGSRASGYSTTAPSGGGISTSSGTVIRGGFGGEGGAHGGESGGHGGGGE